MSKSKIYKLSIQKLIMRILFILILIFINSSMFYFTFHALLGFQNNNNKLGYIGIGFSLLTIYITYYFATVLILFLQYYSNEKGKQLTIDYINNLLIIENKNERVIITEVDLASIQFNLSTKNSKNLTSEYDFIKLTTIEGKDYFITNLIMESKELESFFSKAKIMLKFNKLNFLK